MYRILFTANGVDGFSFVDSFKLERAITILELVNDSESIESAILIKMDYGSGCEQIQDWPD